MPPQLVRGIGDLGTTACSADLRALGAPGSTVWLSVWPVDSRAVELGDDAVSRNSKIPGTGRSQPGHHPLDGRGMTASNATCAIRPDHLDGYPTPAFPEDAAGRRGVVAGDGVNGYARAAPDDREIATCSGADRALYLVRQNPAGRHHAHSVGNYLRQQRLAPPDCRRERRPGAGPHRRLADIHVSPHATANDPRRTRRLPRHLRAVSNRCRSRRCRRGCAIRHRPARPRLSADWELGDDGYLETMWLLAPDAWASARNLEVRQAGARQLWDDAITGYSRWLQSGRPCRDQYV